MLLVENLSNEEMVKQVKARTCKMDVPEFRRTSIGWLERNLGIRNASHPAFIEVMEMVKELRRRGVQ